MNVVRLLLINGLLLLVLLVLLEGAHVVYSGFAPTPVYVCGGGATSYGYCPSVHQRRQMHAADGGAVIDIYSDELGGRQPDRESPSDPASAGHIFIGDSFVQADELPFAQTFYGRLGQHMAVYAMGFSSWNPLQYAGAVERIGVVNAHWHVFIMTNDVNPGYSRSVRAEQQENNLLHSLATRVTNFTRLLRMFYQTIRGRLNPPAMVEAAPGVDFTNGFRARASGDCGPLAKVPPHYEASLGYDYLVYAKDSACWPATHVDAADRALAVLRALRETVESDLEGEVTFYLLPPGWAFPGENLVGRAVAPYHLPADAAISQVGLARYLRSNGIPDLVDLEPEIARELKRRQSTCLECTNVFYLPMDGHWNVEAHAFLADWFRRKWLAQGE